MVLPVRVKTPMAPTLRLASEFWTAEATKPAPKPMPAAEMLPLRASRGWYGSSGRWIWMGYGFAILSRCCSVAMASTSDGVIQRMEVVGKLGDDCESLELVVAGWLARCGPGRRRRLAVQSLFMGINPLHS